MKMNQIREENNNCFETFLEMTTKSDGPRYYNKNYETSKGSNFNYQFGIHTNLRCINIIRAGGNIFNIVLITWDI